MPAHAGARLPAESRKASSTPQDASGFSLDTMQLSQFFRLLQVPRVVSFGDVVGHEEGLQVLLSWLSVAINRSLEVAIFRKSADWFPRGQWSLCRSMAGTREPLTFASCCGRSAVNLTVSTSLCWLLALPAQTDDVPRCSYRRAGPQPISSLG